MVTGKTVREAARRKLSPPGGGFVRGSSGVRQGFVRGGSPGGLVICNEASLSKEEGDGSHDAAYLAPPTLHMGVKP